ncbi:MAG: hypothetical protein ABR497_10500 [Kiritimatiellia bacterium]
MHQDDVKETPRGDVSRLVLLAIVTALLALVALGWPVIRDLRRPVLPELDEPFPPPEQSGDMIM